VGTPETVELIAIDPMAPPPAARRDATLAFPIFQAQLAALS